MNALCTPLALIGYAIFGTSKHLNVGPSSTVAALSFSVVAGLAAAGSDEFISLTIALAMMLAALLLPPIIGQLAIADVVNSFTGGETSTIQELQQGILISLGVAMGLYVLLFGLTWLVVQVRRAVRQTRCPACEQRTQHKHTVGETCEHCGAELAPWLFAEGLPQVESA